jgi:hypothetical protein
MKESMRVLVRAEPELVLAFTASVPLPAILLLVYDLLPVVTVPAAFFFCPEERITLEEETTFQRPVFLSYRR